MANCCKIWCPKCTCCHPPEDREPRTITPNVALPGLKPNDKTHPNSKFKGNKIKTAKYTAWDFIPLNLFKQFQTWSNWFFLTVIVVNFLPGISGFGNSICWFPLSIVLVSTAALDAVEDYERTKSDKKLNNTITLVYRNGQFERIEWKHVYVGDMLRVQCNDIIPADLLVLSSSDANGVCYVETANLDGETNLKQREVMRCLQDVQDFEPQRMSHYRVHIEAPNAEVYRMNGTLCRQTQADPHTNVSARMSRTQALQERNNGNMATTAQQQDEFRISKENVLLRGCRLRNTDYVIGLVLYAGHETKIRMNDIGPALKRSKLDSCILRDMIYCAVSLFLLCASGAIGGYIWLSSFDSADKVPYLIGLASQYNTAAEGTITFFIYFIYLNGIVPLGLAISLQFVKIFQVELLARDIELYDETTNRRVACRAWNLTEALGQVEYLFSDKTGTLTDNVMRFKRCVVNGVDYVFNDASQGGSADQTSNSSDENISYDSTNTTEASENSATATPLLTYTNEIGTMTLRSLQHYPYQSNKSNDAETIYRNAQQTGVANSQEKNNLSLLHHFTFMMSICNTVIVSPTNHTQQSSHAASTSESSSSSSNNNNNNSPLFDAYEAESSDELALVKAACVLGCKLRQRTNNKVSVKLPGEASDVQFDVLRVLPFDSERKRMSIVVQHPVSKAIVLYCKGADSSILPLLNQQYKQTNSDVLARTKQVIDQYATVGLRTLCFAQRVLSTDEYQQWFTKYDDAERAVDNQQEKLREAMQLVERDLTLVGAVGIEDKLQEQVPETIEALRQAGIHVWMLTGDKQETAINIGHSCRLLSTSQQLLVLNESSVQDTKGKISFYLQGIQRLKERLVQYHKQNYPESESAKRGKAKFEAAMVKLAKRDMDLALVIDGSTLQLVLDDTECSTQFLELARYCKSVLCCRTTPLQKGSVVKLVMEKLGKYSLAIGDGANDVSMIKTANVGVGIFGREGLQASMASDFAISRFRYLKKLLLVHGHWSYHRYATLAIILFTMQFQFHLLFFWFQIFNGYSAIDPIDTLYNALYGSILAVLPPIYIGVFDQTLSSDSLMQDPSLYKAGRKSFYYKLHTFWACLANSLWQSLITFGVMYFVYTDSEFGLWEFGVAVYFAGLGVSLLTISIHTSCWNALGLSFMLFSYFLVWLVPLAFNASKSTIASSLPANPYWVIYNHIQTIEFWTTQIACIVLSVLPLSVCKIMTSYIKPTVVHVARVKQAKLKQSNERERKTRSEQSYVNNAYGVDSKHQNYLYNSNAASSDGKHMQNATQANNYPSRSTNTLLQLAFDDKTSTASSSSQSIASVQYNPPVTNHPRPSVQAEIDPTCARPRRNNRNGSAAVELQPTVGKSAILDVNLMENGSKVAGNATEPASSSLNKDLYVNASQLGQLKLDTVQEARL